MAEGGGRNIMQDARCFPKETCAGLQNFPAQLGRQSHLSLKSFISKLDKLLRKYITGHIPSLKNGQTNRSFLPLNWEKLTIFSRFAFLHFVSLISS